jgi:5-formyltetrahydrofolate cyclo-ligase
MMDRTAYRAQMRKLRKAFVAGRSTEALAQDAMALAAHALPLLADFSVIGSYVAIGSEFDPAPLEAILRLRGQRIALPIVRAADAPLDFAYHELGDELTAGPLGSIPQPLASAPIAQPDSLLVPLLAIDPRGYRLGQGAGFYDRTIAARKPIFTLGLAFDCQLIAHIAQAPWDEPLDAIVTPTRFIPIDR